MLFICRSRLFTKGKRCFKREFQIIQSIGDQLKKAQQDAQAITGATGDDSEMSAGERDSHLQACEQTVLLGD